MAAYAAHEFRRAERFDALDAPRSPWRRNAPVVGMHSPRRRVLKLSSEI
jgi:hypothetical protein